MRTDRHLTRTAAAAGVLLLALAACSSDADESDTPAAAEESGTADEPGTADGADGSDVAPEDPDADADPDAEAATEDGETGAAGPEQAEFTAEIDGHTRTGVVLLPSSWTPEAGLPLVISLHGSRSDGAEQVLWADAAGTAEEAGYVVLLPNGGIENPGDGWLWNVPGVTDAPDGAPDDIAFLRGLVEWSAQEYGTSTENVFATGYSGGGRLISQAACDDPELFRAIAPVTGLRAGFPIEVDGGWAPDPASCEPASVTPIVTFVGTDDPVNPLDGGGAEYWGYGHQAALDRWTEIGGYALEEEETGPEGVTVTRIGDGEGPAEIESWSIEGAGHVWPGSPAFEDETDWAGTPSDAIDASDLIWEFFSLHLVE